MTPEQVPGIISKSLLIPDKPDKAPDTRTARTDVQKQLNPEWDIDDPENLPECIDPASLQLHERSCKEILKHNADLTDPIEPDIYKQELIWNTADIDPKPVCLPPRYKMIINQLKKRNGYKWLAEPIRKLVYHGLAIYDHPRGKTLHELMQRDTVQNAIEYNDKNTLDAIGEGVKCDFLAKRCTSVRFNEDFFSMIEERRDDAGINDCEKFVVYLLALSLRTHPGYANWYPEFDLIINDMHRQIDSKIRRLESL